MCAHASNQGGWGGFFTSLLSGCEFFPPNLSVLPPIFFRNLGRFARGRFLSFSNSRAYPSAVWRLNGIALSPLLQGKKVCCEWSQHWNINFWISCFSWLRLFLKRDEIFFGREKFFEWEPSFWMETVGNQISTTLRTCDIFIYTYVLLFDNIRTIRLQVIRWKLPTQPVSLRNK